MQLIRSAGSFSRAACIGTLGLLLSVGCQQSVTTKTTPGALPSGPTLDPNAKISATTYFAHGNLMERQNNYEAAVIQYVRALEVRPDFVTARVRLGVTLNKLGRHDEATAQFQKAVELEADKAYIYNNLGFSLYLEGKYAQAEDALKRALDLQPNFGRARMNHAIVLGKQNRYEEALQEFLQICDVADSNFNLALMLTEAGRYAEAARCLQSALEANPKLEQAREQLKLVSRLAAEGGSTGTAQLVSKTLPTPPAPSDAETPATVTADTFTPTPPDTAAAPPAPAAPLPMMTPIPGAGLEPSNAPAGEQDAAKLQPMTPSESTPSATREEPAREATGLPPSDPPASTSDLSTTGLAESCPLTAQRLIDAVLVLDLIEADAGISAAEILPPLNRLIAALSTGTENADSVWCEVSPQLQKLVALVP